MAVGAKNSDMPMPLMMNAGTIARYSTVGVEIAAIQASPSDIRTMPVTSSGRAPIRSDSTPAIGATKIGIIVHGSVRRPASSGE